jgi:hypothetical protein
MKAKIFFIHLSDEDIAEINDPEGLGWGSPAGIRYMDAKDSKLDATNFEMMKLAAKADFPEYNPETEKKWPLNEAIWSTLNGHGSAPVVRTEPGRSMDIGDIIVWEDGSRYRVASAGFDTIEVDPALEEAADRAEYEASIEDA